MTYNEADMTYNEADMTCNEADISRLEGDTSWRAPPRDPVTPAGVRGLTQSRLMAIPNKGSSSSGDRAAAS